MTLAALHAIDIAIVVAYALVVVLIAWRTQRRGDDAEGYLVAKRRLPGWLVGASLIATSFSSISLMSLPSWGYTGGMMWLQLWVGELLAALVAMYVFVPFYARLKVTTAYEVLEVRLGRSLRILASALFHVVFAVRAGLFLLLAAKALQVLAGWPLDVSLIAVGIAALAYSVLGGLSAVVWTDAIQFVLIVVGLSGCMAVLLQYWADWSLADALAHIGDAADAAGRSAFDGSLTLNRFPTLLSGAIAYGVIVAFVACTNQQSVQRYIACRDVRAAKRAILGAWGVGTVVAALALFIGAAMFAIVGANYAAPDQEILTFAHDALPVGLLGVFAAAVFAAAMSSIDSAIHALSTATLVDFVEGSRGRLENTTRLRTARMFTVAYGIAAIGIAYIARANPDNVFSRLVSWLSVFAGPMLGLFLLARARRRPGSLAAWFAVCVGFVIAWGMRSKVVGAWFGEPGKSGAQVLELAPIWIAALALAATWGLGSLAAWWRPRSAEANERKSLRDQDLSE